MQHIVTLARSVDADAVMRENMRRLKLTKGQCDIAELILGGYDNKDIAHVRGIAYNTAKNNVSYLFHSVGVTSRAGLISLLLGLSAEEVYR